jgi:hypothetical protein
MLGRGNKPLKFSLVENLMPIGTALFAMLNIGETVPRTRELG